MLVDRTLEGKRRKEWENLRLDAARAGMNVETFEELLEAIGRFYGELEGAQEKLAGAKTQEGIVSSRVESQEEHIKDYRENIEDAESSLRKLKEDIGLASFEELEKARDELRILKGRQRELIATLGVMFGEAEDDDKALEMWRSQIQELAIYEEAASGVDYDKTSEEKLEEELDDL